MDGFDDLLAPSRRALEDNPFANPFSNDRSHSPDPWASPFANTQQSDVFGSSSALDPYADSYESLTISSSTPLDQSSEAEEDKATTPTTSPTTVKAEEQPLSDPLDSAAHANDDDDQPPPKNRLPGFRESHDSPQSTFNETATIRPTEPEQFDGLPIPSSANSQTITTPHTAAESRSKVQDEHKHALDVAGSSRGSGFIAHTEPVAESSVPDNAPKSPEFASPLDGGPGVDRIGIDGSFAGLSLGSEGFRTVSGIGGSGSGGWGGDNAWGASSEPTPSTSTAPSSVEVQAIPEDDDSDDDKPISQTLSRIQNEDPDRVVCSLLLDL